MKIKKSNLEKVCGITSVLPKNVNPEFAFVGKSNVGKSSLINVLMNRKSLARVSESPGKTQTINYYNVNDELYFVDLPGYGFAKVSESIKMQWANLIEDYLNNSEMLQVIFLLIDIRHEPGKNDITMYNYIVESGFIPVIIATKLDKINRSAIQKNIKVIRQTLGMKSDEIVIPFSSKTKIGREEILDYIEKECNL